MNKKGFTLIELLVVIIVLGVLAALISGNFFTSLKKGRDAKRKADLEQIQRALEMYYEDKKAYPTFTFPFGGKLCENYPCGRSKEHWRCITRIKEHTRIVCPLVIHYVKLQIVYQEKKYICRNCRTIRFQEKITSIFLLMAQIISYLVA